MLAHRPRRQAAEFPHRSRPARRRGRAGAAKRRARPIRRSTCRSIRAGGISSSTATIAGPPSPSRSDWRDRGARARGPNSISPSSACCSMPAPARRGATAIRRPAQRSAARKGWRWRASRCSRDGAFSADPAEPLRADADALANLPMRRPRARLPGLGRQSAGRASTAAPPCCAGSARLVAAKPDVFAQQRHAAARRPVRSSGDAGRRRHASPRRRSCRAAAATRADLAVAADARRRRRSATAGGIRRMTTARCDQRPGAAAQAVAMAGLFADRAAAAAGIDGRPTSTA